MASDIQFCAAPDHVWRSKMTCCNWNHPSISAHMAASTATTRMLLRSPDQGQNATNGAVHAKVQMHQMGLKHVTCTKSESGRDHCPGRKTGKTEPMKRK